MSRADAGGIGLVADSAAPPYGPTMCNRARYDGEPETLEGSAAKLFRERPRGNRFNPKELRPKSRNYVIREQEGHRF